MLLKTIIKRSKSCVIKYQIKNEERLIERTRQEVIDRSHKYHNGRLNVEKILENITKKSRTKIFKLKRKLVDNQ